MRGLQFCTEAYIEGRETEANAWEGLRHAIVACPIRGVLLLELDPILALSTCPQEAHTFPHTIEYACESWALGIGFGKCGLGFLEQDILELSHAQTSSGWSCRRDFQCDIVVCAHNCCEASWTAGVDTRPVPGEAIQDAGFGYRGRFMSSWLGKVGEQEDAQNQTHKRQEA